MADDSPVKKPGCSILSAVFGRRKFWLRRSTSTGSLPSYDSLKAPTPPPGRRRRSGSDEAISKPSDVVPKPAARPIQIVPPPSGQPHVNNKPLPTHQQQVVAAVQCTRLQQPNNNNNYQVRKNPNDQATQPQQMPLSRSNYTSANQFKRQPSTGISGELERMINDQQRSKGGGTLVRASSGNVMLYGNLGNLRQGGGGGTSISKNVYDQPKNNATRNEGTQYPNGKIVNNVVNPKETQEGSLCRAVSTRMDPEKLKMLGNEDYKNGNFTEALALYEAAIAIDPNKAAYRSNKSAALTALGRILEAVFECREAIRIDPRYHRAHNRLAKLYLRLGDTDKAMHHYKQSGPEADPDDTTKSKKLQAHLTKCTEAKKLKDWNTLVKETDNAISAGADSAPQIFALQAEAYLKLHKFQEAENTLARGPQFDVEHCTKFFGPIGNANLLVIQAQVDMAAGRFDDALAAAQRAAQLDPSNREVNGVTRKARATSAARAKGNDLFKASKFSEACAAYEEGLEHDPHNSVLLCNRAACRSKLGEYEKAVQDCTAALKVRPSYSKARQRRADCNAKLKKWEASIQDYEVLAKEKPEDEEVRKALEEAKRELKKQQVI